MKTNNRPGRILLTFDDGLSTHEDSAALLDDHGLVGTFGVITSLIGSPGFLDWEQVHDIAEVCHVICNHTHRHLWSGSGADKPLESHNAEELTADAICAREILNSLGYHGDWLMLPFGTSNCSGPEHLRRLMSEFSWLRMTVGAPVPAEMGSWIASGGKRLFPSDAGPVVGVSVAADVRRPEAVREAADNAAACGSLAVIAYHSTCHAVGEGQEIVWDAFEKDIKHIAALVKDGRLECVSPEDLTTGTTPIEEIADADESQSERIPVRPDHEEADSPPVADEGGKDAVDGGDSVPKPAAGQEEDF